MKTLVAIVGGCTALVSVGISLLTLVAFIGNWSYGQKIECGQFEVYYRDGVTKAEAEQVVEILRPLFADAPNEISFQLLRDKGEVTFRMAMQPDVFLPETERPVNLQGIDLEAGALDFELHLQEIFGDSNVVVEFCNDRLKPQKRFDLINKNTTESDIAHAQ
ncbi:MAG: hypothetical protein R3C03_16190 [Pirellulaceae bacterium]